MEAEKKRLEPEIKYVRKERVPKKCENCGEPAQKEHTFLLSSARTNPQSSGFRRDDLTFCRDAHTFSCGESECERELRFQDGYDWCATFHNGDRYRTLFLEWKEVELDTGAISEAKRSLDETIQCLEAVAPIKYGAVIACAKQALSQLETNQ